VPSVIAHDRHRNIHSLSVSVSHLCLCLSLSLSPTQTYKQIIGNVRKRTAHTHNYSDWFSLFILIIDISLHILTNLHRYNCTNKSCKYLRYAVWCLEKYKLGNESQIQLINTSTRLFPERKWGNFGFSCSWWFMHL
jgi:hypothetical protein